MPDLTAAYVKKLMHLSDEISDADMEYQIDQAINVLNICGANISNLSGDAGSKSVTLISKQHGGVCEVTRTVYEAFYVRGSGGSGSQSVSIGGISKSSTTTTDIMANPEVWALVEKIGSRLASTSDGIAFIVADDTS